MSARRIEDVIEEVEFLGVSDSPSSIAGRLGYSNPKNLSRVLYRAGRPDLAARFGNDEGSAMSINITTPAPTADVIEALLAKGEKSEKARTRNAANKIREALDDLRERIEAEREDVERAEKIAALEEQIRKLKAGGKVKSAPAATTVGAYACDECERTFDSGQAKAMHHRRAHEGFDPNAARAS